MVGQVVVPVTSFQVVNRMVISQRYSESGTSRGRQASSVATRGSVLAGWSEVSAHSWIRIVASGFARRY